MTDRTVLKPADDQFKPSPGCWWPLLPNGTLVTCPSCGATAALDHTVDDEGNVSPSLVCPADGCGFHEFVRLEGWVC